jgi:hypothetical protein
MLIPLFLMRPWIHSAEVRRELALGPSVRPRLEQTRLVLKLPIRRTAVGQPVFSTKILARPSERSMKPQNDRLNPIPDPLISS